MENLKSLFLDDEQAEKLGEIFAAELMLKRDREYSDRYQLSGGTFTNKGLARRMARIFLENTK
jgi:hypothetical protein